MATPNRAPGERDAARAELAEVRGCPTCDSPQPSMHPAVSGGGEVTGLCPDAFHGAASDGDRAPEPISAVYCEGCGVYNCEQHVKPRAARDGYGKLLDDIAVALGFPPDGSADLVVEVERLKTELARYTDEAGRPLPTDAELDFRIGEVTRERDEARAEVERLKVAFERAAP